MSLSMKDFLMKSIPVLFCCAFISPPAIAQVAGADQGIFNDEEQMLRINNAQIQQYQQQKNEAANALQAEEAKNETYKLYAEKKVAELSKSTASGANKKGGKDDATQLQFYKDWLSREQAYRTRQQNYINQLQSTIQSLQSGQQTTVANLGSDINSMRETVQDKKDAQKFNQMMQINYFNELQSEMGACSWGRPPTDGTFNSTGGYGMLGGYGYGMGMGRRNYW